MLRAIDSSITSPCWRRSSGTRPMPAAIAAVGEPRRSASPLTVTAAGVVAVDPEDRAGDLAAAGADEPGERDDLAGSHLEGDVDEDALARQALDLRARCRRASAAPAAALGELAADHRPHEIVGREAVRARATMHAAAVAQHGDALAEREDLLEAVRDEEHRRAVGAQASRRRRTGARPRRPRAPRSARP